MPRLPLLCVAFLVACCLPAAGADRPPNILMIISDDHAWTDYGFMGSKEVSTPHLDRLAAESRVFPRGYDTNSLCSPSLASILTGRHVHRHGPLGKVVTIGRQELHVNPIVLGSVLVLVPAAPATWTPAWSNARSKAGTSTPSTCYSSRTSATWCAPPVTTSAKTPG